MQKIFKLFPENSKRSFIRAIIFDDYLTIHHIKNGITHNKTIVNISNSQELFVYLQNNCVPIEIIIGSSSMSCKSISSKEISIGDMKSIAKNTMEYKKDSINTIFYGNKKLINNEEHLSICEAFINNAASSLIQKLFMIKNPIRCVTVWPVWIVSSYFSKFLEDEHKFKYSLFVFENEDIWEIIGYNSKGFVCYRHGYTKFSDKKTEIEITIKHLIQTQKISHDDVAIYMINEDVIDGFTAHSSKGMSILSTVIDDAVLPFNYNISKIASMGLLSFCMFFLSIITTNIFQINSISNKIESEHKITTSIKKDIQDESKEWSEVKCNEMKQYDFKEILRENIKNSKQKGTLQMAKLEVKESGDVAVDFSINEEN